MICFQILTFAVSATALTRCYCQIGTLWFAFKFLPLQYLRQLYNNKGHIYHSCDLLSNSYLCSICDSNSREPTRRTLLWFAFKFLPLQYLRQRRKQPARNLPRCDLLSNSYLCSICDSDTFGYQRAWYVVICFQILTFAVSATAFASSKILPVALWFAFKFLPLQYLRQQSVGGAYDAEGCDLLSNSYLCSICDSRFIYYVALFSVVICFQILTFAVSATAYSEVCPIQTLLWFAFKFLPLQYLRQRNLLKVPDVHCCDLLSNSYLCSICDSFCSDFEIKLAVVICFQILTFAVSATAFATQFFFEV